MCRFPHFDLLLAGALLWVQANAQATAACLTNASGGFNYTLELLPGLKLQYSFVSLNGTAFMKAKVTSPGAGWVGFGFSPDGGMAGSNVVVGQPGVSVAQYDLQPHVRTNPAPYALSARQSLNNTSVQVANGTAVLEFSRPVADLNFAQTPTKPQWIVSAYNLASKTLVKHNEHVSYLLVLDPCNTTTSSDTTPNKNTTSKRERFRALARTTVPH